MSGDLIVALYTDNKSFYFCVQVVVDKLNNVIINVCTLQLNLLHWCYGDG